MRNDHFLITLSIGRLMDQVETTGPQLFLGRGPDRNDFLYR